MADHNIDILLRARDMASKQIKAVSKSLDTLGARASRGIKTAGRNLLRLGAIAGGVAAGIGVLAVKSGIDSLVTLENAVTSVDGAIKQMGLTGKVSSAQIAKWANEIEASTEAAFDDKDITSATATLIRYGKVTQANIRPAMEVMTDLAAKTGSVESASTLLARALADPTKAAGKLARAGIILTKQEQKRLTQLVKTNKLGKAQELILDSLARTTKGAAKDAFGPVADSQNQMNDAIEDASRAFATGFLPLIQRASKAIQGFLGRSDVQQGIKDLGDGIANAFDKAMDFASKIPWGRVQDALGKAAGFAGNLINAFASMPPEAQATILALAGLDRLSGGAISGIVGELGKGLIKGVLGITAGVVNVNAGVVKGGGVPTPGGGGGKGGGVTGVVKGAAAVALPIAGVGAFAAAVQKLGETFNPPGSKPADVTRALKDGSMTFNGRVMVPTNRAIEGVTEKQRGTLSAVERSGGNITSAVNMAASRISSAVAAAAPRINVNVGVSSITKTTVIQNRAGKPNGSQGGSSFWGGAGPR